MLNPSNSISFLRAPLALLFIIESTMLRVILVLLAMLTDWVDGYLARRYRYTSQFGAVLDPIMDKFFVYFALTILFIEGRIEVWQAIAMISRDFFLFVFALYLIIKKSWTGYRFKSIRWGKITTAAQFSVLIALSLKLTFPPYLYGVFIAFGALAFVELIRLTKPSVSP